MIAIIQDTELAAVVTPKKLRRITTFKVQYDGLNFYQRLKEFFKNYNNELYYQGTDHQIPIIIYYYAAL